MSTGPIRGLPGAPEPLLQAVEVLQCNARWRWGLTLTANSRLPSAMAFFYAMGELEGRQIMCELEKLLDSAATIVGLFVFAFILLLIFV